MKIPLVDLRAQYRAISSEVDAALRGVLERGALVLGSEVSDFEEEFAAFCGAEHAVGVASGTAALELALRALGVGPGDEVITAPNSFFASAAAISLTGATPVFADVDPDTLNLAPDRVRDAITERTAALLPVHLYGQPADMGPLVELAREHGLAVVEDAAQAHGAEYRGRRVGSLGDAAAFSFYPSKNLGAFGDGGAVTTCRREVAERVRSLRAYGEGPKNVHTCVAGNQRLDALQAAALRVKLRHLDGWNQARRRAARRYDELLLESGLQLPVRAAERSHVFHLYAVRTPRRDALRAHLEALGIGVGVHYPTPIPFQEAYRHLGLGPGAFPVAERSCREELSLPLYPELEDTQVETVCEAVLDFV